MSQGPQQQQQQQQQGYGGGAGAGPQGYGGGPGPGPQGYGGPPQGYGGPSHGGPQGLMPGLPPNTNLEGGPGCVLHVSVVDCYYPVTIDILHTVFQPYGPVIRVVLVNKKTVGYNEAPNNLQALIQFSDAALANAARIVRLQRRARQSSLPCAAHAIALALFPLFSFSVVVQNLSNKYIFDGSGLLRIQVANSESLNVKFNNERQRSVAVDQPSLPSSGKRES